MGSLTPTARRGAKAAHHAAELAGFKTLLLEALNDPAFAAEVRAALAATIPQRPAASPQRASARQLRDQRVRGTRG